MTNHPTIAALKERLESERKNGADLWKEQYTRPIFCNGYEESYKYGHEAATARLMPILEQAVEVIKKYEPYCIINFVESEVKGFNSYKIKEFWLAREFLLSIRETVTDASTLADASGEITKPGHYIINAESFDRIIDDLDKDPSEQIKKAREKFLQLKKDAPDENK